MTAALKDVVMASPLAMALCDMTFGDIWEQWIADQWEFCARDAQQPVRYGDWRVWLMMAGRGFGKTRSGAEWVDAMARDTPGVRIALIGATMDDVRHVMVEGGSGIMNLSGSTDRPTYAPSLKRLLWPNGSMAMCYSASEPESLRGPQHHFAWGDEVARWNAGRGGDGAVMAW